MKKKLIFLFFVLALVPVFFLAHKTRGKNQTYYNGDAIYFNHKLLFASVNSGVFELFAVENNKIHRVNVLQSDDGMYYKFHDFVFNKENNDLFVYLTNRKYLYKYKIDNLYNFTLLKKIKDNSGDLFYGLSKSGEHIMTMGVKGVKLWNYDLQNINDFAIYSSFAKNIKISDGENFIFSIVKNNFKIIDTYFRDVILEKNIKIREDHIRAVYDDKIRGEVFVVDDYSLNRIKFNGDTKKFHHISNLGYDVDGVLGSNHLYFSDGVGVVKIDKETMKPLDWVWTNALGTTNGWAMGLRALLTDQGERIVLFNGANILLLDDKLDLIDFYAKQEQKFQAGKNLNLKCNTKFAWPGDTIVLEGSGFGEKEPIKVFLAGEEWQTSTNYNGYFKLIMKIPELKKQRTDLRALGTISGSTYSLSFEIK